jgi:hypothetical protein
MLVTDLCKRLSHDFVCVARPDLPHLLLGPDLLIAAPGNLVAAFVTKAAERRDKEALLSRLILTRLALPQRARCLLVTQEEDDGGLSATDHFDGRIRANKIAGIRQFCEDRNARGDTTITPDEIRSLAHARYSIVFNAARKLTAPFIAASSVESPDVNQAKSRHRRPDEDAIPTPSAEGTFDKKDRVMWLRRGAGLSLLRQDVGHSVLKAFQLDRGVPYPKDLRPDLLVAADIPIGRLDPMLPIRGAAFGGCLVTPEDHLDEASTILERIDRRIGLLHR